MSTLQGKTRPPPVDAHQQDFDGNVSSEAPVESVAPPPQNGSISGLPNQCQTSNPEGQTQISQAPGSICTDLNDLRSAGMWANPTCQSQGLLSVGDDGIQGLDGDIQWTEWSVDGDLNIPSTDDIGATEAVRMSTDLATLPTVFTEAPLQQADTSAMMLARRGNSISYPLSNPVDLPTTLIEYWFTHVCSMWCAYDSPQNWYRNLAGDTWHHSEPVYYALQAMSASVLVDSLPHLKQALPALTTQAAQSIQRAIQADITLQGDQARPLPTDLLLAVMGMGTSICWADPRQLGFWFLDQARGLLKRYSKDGDPALDAHGQQTAEYFRQALIYWEMLANVVTKDYQSMLWKRRSKFKKRIRRAMSMDDSGTRSSSAKVATFTQGTFPKKLEEPLPHPWTGVSGDIQQTFGLVMGLCQNRCVARNSDTNLSADNLCDALCDIELANDLERELLSFDFNDNPQDHQISSNDTGDPNAPLSHLVDTAEAYRLASLLHLYLAFSDLEVKFVRNVAPGSDGLDGAALWTQAPADMQRDQALITLTLRLVDVLKRIPADSGARCIQPILLISAAAGLKFDVPAHSARSPGIIASQSIHPKGTMINHTALADASLNSCGNGQPPNFFGDLDPSPTCPDNLQLTSLTLEVSAGRRFVVNRLGALQQSLPPRPIGVALALVRAVWFNYDSADERLRGMHWMNTMVNSGLQTLFG